MGTLAQRKAEHAYQGYLQREYDQQSKLEGGFAGFMFKDMNTREDTRTPPNKGDDVEQNLWDPSGVRSGERFINAHYD